jgi:hypothetical protein
MNDHIAKKNYLLCLLLLILGLLGLGMAGCKASSLSPTASSATPTGTSVFGVWPSESHRASPIHPVQVTPTPTLQPADVPVEWLYIGDPTYGISWKEPNNWYGIQENWPISIPGAILLRAVASEKNAPLLLSSPQPIFPNGLMVLTVYAVRPEVPPPALHDAQPITVSGQTGWIQETKGAAAMPFTWQATLFIQGTSAYSYTLSFGCTPPTGADDAGQTGFQAFCQQIWEHILEGIEIQGTPPCAPVPTPLPGPITWKRIHSDWYQYSFEVPSGWYEGETASPDRRHFSSVPMLSGPFPYYCPSPYGWMKLDFGVHPLQYQPDLTGMDPVTIAGRPAWVLLGKGRESASFVEFSAYISGPQYWYHLWFGCAPGEGENEVREAFVAQCTDVMEHILGSFQFGP